MQFVSLLHRFFEGRFSSGIANSASDSTSEEEDVENVAQDHDDQSDSRSRASSDQLSPPDREQNLHRPHASQQDFDLAADINDVGFSEHGVPCAQRTQDDLSRDFQSPAKESRDESQQAANAAVQNTTSSISVLPMTPESSSNSNPNPEAEAEAEAEAEGARKGTSAKKAMGVRGNKSNTARSGANAPVISRASHKTVSLTAMWKCALVLKHVDSCDWKLFAPGSYRPPLEDVVLVINPQHHLVDAAWRRVRSYCNTRKLSAVRAKLTNEERANLHPKVNRRFAFLVIVANSREVAKRVLAAERVRLGFTGPASDATGLKLVGVPLSPSALPVQLSSTASVRFSGKPEVSIGGSSPVKFLRQLEEKRKSQLDASVVSVQRIAETAAGGAALPPSKRLMAMPPSDRVTRRKFIKDECVDLTSGSGIANDVPGWIRDSSPAPGLAVINRSEEVAEEEAEEHRAPISMDFTPT